MQYELRLSAPSLDVLPLVAIADAVARAVATAGGTPLHKPTYQGKLRKVSEWIIDDARGGRLAVTDQDGRPGTFDEVIQRAKNDGTYSEVRQSQTSSEVDLTMTQALCVFTTLLHLNAWARERGDEFSISACGWIDERGWVEPNVVIEKAPTVIFLIGGRETVPVRTIPFVTGWEVSPDVLASSFAHTAKGLRLERLPAYQLHSDGSHTQTLPKEWDGVEDALKGLSATLRAKNSDMSVTRPEWLRKSISLLPAGVFVWKDDFEKSFWRQFSTDSPLGVINLDGTRPGDGILNFSPMIPDALLREQVCEGFTFQRAVTESAPQVPAESQEVVAPSRASKSVALQAKQAKLLKIVEALERYAEKTNQPFDRHAMPGPLGGDWNEDGSFHWFCARLCRDFIKAKTTFESYRAGICAVQKYAKAGDFYGQALLHIAPMFGERKK